MAAQAERQLVIGDEVAPADAVKLVIGLLRAGAVAGDLDAVGVYKQFDADNDGHINAEEFTQTLTRLGVVASEETLVRIYKEFDKSGDNKLRYYELRKLVFGRQ
jgi:hypothetical protein